ncbi:hypothetical protein BDE02_16G085300 [Populus trichocarpa]|nr:hypothetical protein BDE02_16G085300 [Populus trichocarpa]
MKTKINCLCCVLGVLQVTALSPPAEKGRGDETEPDPPGFQVFDGGAWEDAPPLFIRVQKVSLHCKGFVGVCFVIFKVFDVMFV